MSDAWGPQDGETAKAFAAFQIYRDASPLERSLALVAKNYYDLDGPVKGKERAKRAQIDTWSSRNNWVARAKAYDQWVDEQSRLQHVADVLAMRKRHVTIGKEMQKLGVKALSKLQPEKIDAMGISKLLREGINIERTARGEPESVPQSQADQMLGEIDYGNLTDDELAALRAIALRARAAGSAGDRGGTEET